MKKILWVTSYGPDMAKSGQGLIESFERLNVVGELAVYYEGPMADVETAAKPSRVRFYDLATDPMLAQWLATNRHTIPPDQGGTAGICHCGPGGKSLDPHHKAHQGACPGYWFNRNASRWYRKIVSLQRAMDLPEPCDALIWIDSDCRFCRTVLAKHVETWFPDNAALFYLKNRRQIVESGVVGYRPAAGGFDILRQLINRYQGDPAPFQKSRRWDDSYQLQWCIDRAPSQCVDLATAVSGNSQVLPHSSVGAFLTHDKGAHRRSGIMT